MTLCNVRSCSAWTIACRNDQVLEPKLAAQLRASRQYDVTAWQVFETRQGPHGFPQHLTGYRRLCTQAMALGFHTHQAAFCLVTTLHLQRHI